MSTNTSRVEFVRALWLTNFLLNSPSVLGYSIGCLKTTSNYSFELAAVCWPAWRMNHRCLSHHNSKNCLQNECYCLVMTGCSKNFSWWEVVSFGIMILYNPRKLFWKFPLFKRCSKFSVMSWKSSFKQDFPWKSSYIIVNENSFTKQLIFKP